MSMRLDTDRDPPGRKQNQHPGHPQQQTRRLVLLNNYTRAEILAVLFRYKGANSGIEAVINRRNSGVNGV